MLRVEGLASSHQATLDTLTRQMEKVQVRARLVGRDLRSPLRQLETGAAAQGEVLASLAVRLEAMEGELKDTETLVAALQGAWVAGWLAGCTRAGGPSPCCRLSSRAASARPLCRGVCQTV